MEKLTVEDVLKILKQAIEKSGNTISKFKGDLDETVKEDLPKYVRLLQAIKIKIIIIILVLS